MIVRAFNGNVNAAEADSETGISADGEVGQHAETGSAKVVELTTLRNQDALIGPWA